MKNKQITIVGTGALGSILARGLSKAGFSIISLFNHYPEKAKKLAASINTTKTGVFPEAKSGLGKIIFITVPDQNIEGVAGQLAEIDEDFRGYTIIHCSGNKSSMILQSLQKKGAAVASFHPIQTFTDISVADDLKEIYVDIEGDQSALQDLRKLSSELGCHTIPISAEAKPYLHAAAVMASNNMVALIESAGQIAQLGGMDKNNALRALMPLMKKSMENIARSNHLEEALSGPIARADVLTIAEHLSLLETKPQLLALYKQLGGILVDISKRNDIYRDGNFHKILTLLNGRQ